MITLLLLMALLQFPHDFMNQLTGTWLNHDPATTGITQIVVMTENGVLRAHAWGACTPLDFDWSAAELGLNEGIPTTVFNLGSITTTLYLVRLPNDKLLVSYKSHFAERPNYEEPMELKWKYSQLLSLIGFDHSGGAPSIGQTFLCSASPPHP